jgi:hypothetical protein
MQLLRQELGYLPEMGVSFGGRDSCKNPDADQLDINMKIYLGAAINLSAHDHIQKKRQIH